MGLMRKPVPQLGSVVVRGNGWRVRACFAKAYGPKRKCKREAETDLKHARAAQTREEYCDILRELTRTVQSQHAVCRRAKANAKAKAKAEAKAGRKERQTQRQRQREERQNGIISRYGNGWRVTAVPAGHYICGPFRARKRDADDDLKKARTAKTGEEYRDIISLLHFDIKSGSHVVRNDTVRRYAGRKGVSRLGTISRFGIGWRVRAAPTGHVIYGPYRVCRQAADADLKQVRTAKTREEYRSILLQLTEEHLQLRMRGRSVMQPASGAEFLTESRLKSDECNMASSQIEKTQDTDAMKSRSYKMRESLIGDRLASGCVNLKPVSQLGTTRAHGNGWRVVASIEGRAICGPYRVNKSDADIDLNQVRTAKTRREYAGILWQLKETIRATASSETEEDASVTSDEVREMPPQTEKRRESQLQPEAMKEEADDSGTRWRWT